MVQELQSLGLAASPKNPHPRELTYADLAELVYLQAVVKVPVHKLCFTFPACLRGCPRYVPMLMLTTTVLGVCTGRWQSMSVAGDKRGQGLMQETLRMFPPVAIGQARIVSADLSAGNNLRLPSGTCAIVPHHAMHSSSLNWDKPNEFLPGEDSPHSSWNMTSWGSHA